MKEQLRLGWLILGLLIAWANPLNGSTSPQRSLKLEWKIGRIGNRSVAVLARRPDIERDRRSVMKENNLKEIEDIAEAWLKLHPGPDELLGGKTSAGTDAEDIKSKPVFHRKRHDKNKRKRRNKNEESRRIRRMRRKKEKGIQELNSQMDSNNKKSSMERLQEEKRKRKRRGDKKKNKDRRRRNGKEKKKNRRKGSRNKKRRNPKNNNLNTTAEAVKYFPTYQNETELKGKDACQYLNLKQCTLNVGIFMPEDSSDPEVESKKCFKRKKFLECMEKERESQTCNSEMKVEGNILALRDNIRAVIWTNSSCILTEALKGK